MALRRPHRTAALVHDGRVRKPAEGAASRRPDPSGERRTAAQLVSKSLRSCLLVLALACGLATATPALALPHFSKARSREISSLVDRFVKDVVLRRDLADGWKIAGPQLRTGTTRKAWVAGRALPVQQFPLQGRSFRNAWYGMWATRSEIGLVVSLRSGHGKNAKMIQEQVVLVRYRGRWAVNSFYVNGIFRLGRGHKGSCVGSNCAVTGLSDYGPGSGGGGSSSLGPRPGLGRYWVWILLGGLAGVPLTMLLAAGGYVVWRDRRARTDYLASRSP